ncbi:hypothetical protein QBC39DRAFT_18053 [Podospora conica]|nr:hypothetical protein QBC39DRAFT_18053 [Schizothecium conicum]
MEDSGQEMAAGENMSWDSSQTPPDTPPEDAPLSVTQPGTQQPFPEHPITATIVGSEFQDSTNIHIGHIYQSRDGPEPCLVDLENANQEGEKHQITSTQGGLLPKAHLWLLENENFKGWRSLPGGKVLWVKGDAGKGKTMLLCGAIDVIKPDPAQTDETLPYFFCQNSSALSVIKGLLAMLVHQQPSLRRHVRECYGNAGQATLQMLRGLLIKILAALSADPTKPPTYLFIDALDKCHQNRTQLLALILESASIDRVKWFVTSRAWDEIEHHLGSRQAKEVEIIDLNEHDQAVSSAIEAYIDRRALSLIADDTTQRQIIVGLRSKARNVAFPPAVLFANALQRLSASRQQELLNHPGTIAGVNDFYEQIAEDIQHQSQETSELCRHVLAFAVIAYRPLTHAELRYLTALDDEVGERALRLCRHFFALDDSVCVLEQPAKEFLSRKQDNRLFPNGFGKYHGELFSGSIKAMSMTLRRNLYKLQHPNAPVPSLSPSEEAPLVNIRYMCAYWIDHLLEARSARPGKEFHDQDIQDLTGFLTGHYLHWLEALSLLGETGTLSLWTDLLDCLRADSRSAFDHEELQLCVELAEDADHLLNNHKQCIMAYPLQAYGSALVFAPSQRQTNTVFGIEKPDWVEVCFKVEGRNPCKQTLDLKAPIDGPVYFSSDGQRLAVVVLGPSGKQVRILDLAAKSGSGWSCSTHASSSCSTDGSSCSAEEWSGNTDGWIAFPPRKKKDVIAISNGGKVEFFNLVATSTKGLTAKCVQDLPIAMRANVSTFCPDGTYLVTGNETHIEMWDWEKSRDSVLRIPHLVDTPVRSLACSSRGTKIASAHGATIYIWNTGTGLTELEIRCPAVPDLVSFISSSSQLVSASNGPDGSSFITWDAITGDRQQKRQACTQPDRSRKIAFSTDGHFLAVAPRGVIRTWDVRGGRPLQTIEGYIHDVKSLAFSPDRTQLVTSHDGQLRVWDLLSGDFKADTNQHTDMIRAVKISQDGTKIVSVSSRTIKVWDPEPGGDSPYTILLRPHESEISDAVVSPNGSQVLSIPSSHVPCTLWSIEGNPSPPTGTSVEGNLAACFSSDGTKIATLDHFGQVRLRNTILQGAGRSKPLFRHSELRFGPYSESHTLIGSVAFSLAGKHVASSFDGYIRIWDLDKRQSLFDKYTCETPVSLCLFSLNNRRPHLAASYGHGNRLEIWDLATASGELARTIEHCPASVDLTTFNETTRLYLTSLGRHGEASQHIRGYGFDPGLEWITWGPEKVLWLPHNFRPDTSSSVAVAVVGADPLPETIIAFASRSTNNRLRILRFPAGKHPPGVKVSHEVDDANQGNEPQLTNGTAITAADEVTERPFLDEQEGAASDSSESTAQRANSMDSDHGTIRTVETGQFRGSYDSAEQGTNRDSYYAGERDPTIRNSYDAEEQDGSIRDSVDAGGQGTLQSRYGAGEQGRVASSVLEDDRGPRAKPDSIWRQLFCCLSLRRAIAKVITGQKHRGGRGEEKGRRNRRRSLRKRG